MTLLAVAFGFSAIVIALAAATIVGIALRMLARARTT